MKQLTKSKIRIIAGKWRSRNLEFLDSPEIRPTPNRLRETLFNLLTPAIDGAVCLDLFAGSGIMGFEAVSRGAAHTVLVDSNRRICQQISSEIRRFGTDDISVVHSPAEHFIASCETPYDIIFLDPPFGSDLLEKTLASLGDSSCLSTDKTVIYIEHKANETPAIPESWRLLRDFKAAQVKCKLLVSAQ